ncbi:MAG TPA: methyltransferase domain-containing protein [Bryobacteraceae bacterium]|nr:methyltransferase domain-containing protein [Bryobacteraceae bacterium]
MDDRWYEIATLDHPWIVRRFEVLRRFGGALIATASAIAEFGCGHGLLQRQIEDSFDASVAGFDLNTAALAQSVSRYSPRTCYNVLERRAEYKAAFDLILLADVLEHIEDEAAFLRAIGSHLAPGGSVIINVPALQPLYSGYDRAVGHVRRYCTASLARVAQRSGMAVASYTYWGLPLIPLLVLRKFWDRSQPGEQIASGFQTGSAWRDRALLYISRCELVPQRLIGSSLMAVLKPR